MDGILGCTRAVPGLPAPAALHGLLMRAVVLAAGRGSRMGRLTDASPKCLATLGGKPLIRWQLDALRGAGVGPVAVVRGYRGERLAGVADAVFENVRWADTRMVSSLACAAPWLECGPCIVSQDDAVYHPDVVARLAAATDPIAVAYDRLWHLLWTDRFDDPLAGAGSLRIAPDGGLTEIGRHPASLDDIAGQYIGLVKFTPDGWEKVAALLCDLGPAVCDGLDMSALLDRLITRGVRVGGVAVDGRWCVVDSASDLELYERLRAGPGSWTHDWTR